MRRRSCAASIGEIGATAVEYAIMAALVAGVIVAAAVLLGSRTADLYCTTSTAAEAASDVAADC